MFPGSPNVETMVLLEKAKKKPHSLGRDGRNARGKAQGTKRNDASPHKSNRAAKKAAKRGKNARDSRSARKSRRGPRSGSGK